MFKKISYLFLIITNYFHNGESVNYYPYTNKMLPQSSVAVPQIEHHLLHDVAALAETYNTHNAANSYLSYPQNPGDSTETTNLQANRNYQQFYRYNNEATTLRQQQQQQPYLPQPTTSTQLWSGPPIVVDNGDDTYLTSNNPQTTYTTPYNTLLSMRRHSKALPTYNNQPQSNQPTTTQQLNFDNNNNIVYHRDFRHEIDALPSTKPKDVQQLNGPFYAQQQQLYASNTNTPYDYALESSRNNFNLNNHQYNSNRNYYRSLRRDNVIDYTDYFKRYLENNPRRIQPLY